MAYVSKSENSYITTSLLAGIRADGRSPTDYRNISLEIGVVPVANGSARARVGETEVVAAIKLEVEDVGEGENEGRDGGRVLCHVSCTPSAYPHHSLSALDELSDELSSLLQSILSHTLTPSEQLTLVPGKKAWFISLDALILSDAGNAHDALFIAARAALWDLRIPYTRGIEFDIKDGEVVVGDSEGIGRMIGRKRTVDFELPDLLDDGVPLEGRDSLPVCISLNLLPPTHFLDASLQEEQSVLSRLLLFFSFPQPSPTSTLYGTRFIGPNELPFNMLKPLVKDGEKYARELAEALNKKLKQEESQVSAPMSAFG
ncbi:hypothetical protein BOTBODRAFT_100718 [Botryobasidium botryosum FD-172 SS1]|uniref:Ribosomal RNA-processing protein 42 n=1 Tax=Botryobasidium botryosum (strain FD-172 SS1) TaxID=930990 RepID=A0A067NAT3_BOTB1|nr:hypothetical protein BOTBODRAFT_100718 [Botryobasidium botryosum FD-172 SS1]